MCSLCVCLPVCLHVCLHVCACGVCMCVCVCVRSRARARARARVCVHFCFLSLNLCKWTAFCRLLRCWYFGASRRAFRVFLQLTVCHYDRSSHIKIIPPNNRQSYCNAEGWRQLEFRKVCADLWLLQRQPSLEAHPIREFVLRCKRDLSFPPAPPVPAPCMPPTDRDQFCCADAVRCAKRPSACPRDCLEQ